MNNKTTIFLISCLILSLISTLYVKQKSNKLIIKNHEINAELNDYKYIESRHKDKYEETLFSENIQLSDIAMINSNLDTVYLESIIDKPKLIYRFYQETCVQCYEDELDILKKLSEKIGIENVLIISDFGKMNQLRAIINRKNIKSSFFNYSNKLGLPIDEDDRKIASFFVIDQNLRTRFVFKAGGDQNIEDPYYRRILKFFKTGW